MTVVVEEEVSALGSVGDLEIERTYMLRFSSINQPFILDMDTSTTATALGFDELADRGGIQGQQYSNVQFAGKHRMFGCRVDPTGAFELCAPGVVSLAGEGYCKLRCPEIERYIDPIADLPGGGGITIFKLLCMSQPAH
jgi:hypothetical protein